MPDKITASLWFDSEAEEAAKFYTSIFENSRIVDVKHYPEGAPRPAGSVMTVEFELDGLRIVALNGGPQFTFNEAVTLLVECEAKRRSTTSGSACPMAARRVHVDGSRTATAWAGR